MYDHIYFGFDSVHVNFIYAQVRFGKVTIHYLNLTAVRGIFDFHPVEKLKIGQNTLIRLSCFFASREQLFLNKLCYYTLVVEENFFFFLNNIIQLKN